MAVHSESGSDHHLVHLKYEICCLARLNRAPARIYQALLKIILKAVPADRAFIALLSPESNQLEVVARTGFKSAERPERVVLGQGSAGWVAMHGHSLLVVDTAEQTRIVDPNPDIRSELIVPMGEPVFGVIALESSRPRMFQESHLLTLSSLASESELSLSAVWRRARLNAQARRLQSVVSGASVILKTRSQEGIVEYLANLACVAIEADAACVFRPDAEGNQLLLECAYELWQDKEQQGPVGVHDCVAGSCYRLGKAIATLDLLRDDDPLFNTLHPVDSGRERLFASSFCLPIAYEDKCLGVLVVFTLQRHRFDNEERHVLRMLADVTAASWQNLMLYERIFQTEESMRRTERLTTLGLISAEIAHEIRNPLTVIQLLFESLELEFPNDDMRQKDAAIIREKLEQLEAIVARVLSFGKSREEMRGIYDLNTLIEDTLLLVRLKLQQSRCQLETRIEPDRPVRIEVVKGQIQQVLLNLIFNAVQSMPEGGTIRLSTRIQAVAPGEPKDGPMAVLEVADTGAGIPPDLIDRIFDSFLTGHREGTGLGLAIAKRIIKAHRGSIEVVSTSDAGTVIAVSLPLVEKP